jgi:hypothetical protein
LALLAFGHAAGAFNTRSAISFMAASNWSYFMVFSIKRRPITQTLGLIALGWVDDATRCIF